MDVDNIEKEVEKIDLLLNNKDDDDDAGAYGLYLARKLRKLTPYRRASAIRKIDEVLMEIEFGSGEGQHSTHNDHVYSFPSISDDV